MPRARTATTSPSGFPKPVSDGSALMLAWIDLAGESSRIQTTSPELVLPWRWQPVLDKDEDKKQQQLVDHEKPATDASK